MYRQSEGEIRVVHRAEAGSGNEILFDAAFPDDTWEWFVVTKASGVGLDKYKFYTGGVDETLVDTNDTASSATITVVEDFYIGSRHDNASYGHVECGDMMLFNTELSPADISNLDEWINTKWNI